MSIRSSFFFREKKAGNKKNIGAKGRLFLLGCHVSYDNIATLRWYLPSASNQVMMPDHLQTATDHNLLGANTYASFPMVRIMTPCARMPTPYGTNRGATPGRIWWSVIAQLNKN